MEYTLKIGQSRIARSRETRQNAINQCIHTHIDILYICMYILCMHVLWYSMNKLKNNHEFAKDHTYIRSNTLRMSSYF